MLLKSATMTKNSIMKYTCTIQLPCQILTNKLWVLTATNSSQKADTFIFSFVNNIRIFTLSTDLQCNELKILCAGVDP